jgi:hypothetical protein
MAEKAGWDQANRQQNIGLVLSNRTKISQIIKDKFYLPGTVLLFNGSIQLPPGDINYK